MFRHIGIEPTGSLDVDLQSAGLNWKTVKVPMGSISPKTGDVEPIPGRFNLHRSDGKGPGKGYLDSCSDRYHPPQNREMFQTFQNLVDAGGLRTVRIGELHGGRRVFALAETERVEAVNVGDQVQLMALLSTMHVPGAAYTLKLFVKRLACSNGMTLDDRAAMWRMSHRSRFSNVHRERMAQALAGAENKFGAYLDAARAMFAVVYPFDCQENFVTEVYQPGLLADVIRESEGLERHKAILERAAGKSESETGKIVLDAITSVGPVTVPNKALQRGTRQVIQSIVNQPGRSGQNVWNAVNAVTYHVDHVRGRNSDSGVEAAYFGAGESLKNRAQNLAEYITATEQKYIH
jgi:hypothetical protein